MKQQKQITLGSFIKAEKRDLDQFLEWWISQNKESPSQFPLKMNWGDWHDQFGLFIYNRDERP